MSSWVQSLSSVDRLRYPVWLWTVLFSLALHVLCALFFLLETSLFFESKFKVDNSRIISASLVQVERPKRRSATEKAKPPPKKPKAKPAVISKPKKEVPKAETASEKPPQKWSWDSSLASSQEFQDLLAAEEAQLISDRELKLVEKHINLISLSVQGYWKRPPDARNDMLVILLVQILPSGEIASVNVSRSSGNARFDQAALNALRKVKRFPQIAELEPAIFERHFRRLRLKFRPTDLSF